MSQITKVYELDDEGNLKQVTTLSNKRKRRNVSAKVSDDISMRTSVQNNRSRKRKRGKTGSKSSVQTVASDSDHDDFKIITVDNDSSDSDVELIEDEGLDEATRNEIRDLVNDRRDLTELLDAQNEKFVAEGNELWKPFRFTRKDRTHYNRLKKVSLPYDPKKVGSTVKQGWVSATGVKNFMFNDPIVDWLDRCYDHNKVDLYDTFVDKRPHKRPRRNCTLTKEKLQEIDNTMECIKGDKGGLSILFTNGIEFENKVNISLSTLANIKCREFEGPKFVTVFTHDDYLRHKKRTDMKVMKEKTNETIEFMKLGVPVISQAVLMNSNNYTYGVADLLVRSDYLNEFFTTKLDDDTLDAGSPNISKMYHYRVIDIKWTTITLCVNGLNLRNEARIPSYKAQLAIYNAALGEIQGYTPSCSYVMAKAWFIDSKNSPERGYSCFDRLGVVDYDGFDKKYIVATKNAIQWVHRVSLVGRSWNLNSDKPDIIELYPNMCNRNDGIWDQFKKLVAETYDEITNVWYVGVNHRKTAHGNGVMRISDPNCTTDALGISRGSRKRTIDQILDTNRSEDTVIKPDVLHAPRYEHWLGLDYGDYYVDFETINGALQVSPDDIDILNSKSDHDITFMVGIGFDYYKELDTSKVLERLGLPSDSEDVCGMLYNRDNNWEYVCFYMKESCIEQERSVYEKFMNFIHEREQLIKSIKGKDTIVSNNLFHWTVAEPKFMESAKKRHYDPLSEHTDDVEMVQLYDRFSRTCMWLDLYKMFTSVPITIKNCYNFRLKSVTKAMKANGLITTDWPDNGIAEGLTAMLVAIKLYKQVDNTEKDLSTDTEFNAIIDYNEIDCKAMWDIKHYLRKKYILGDDQEEPIVIIEDTDEEM